MTNESTLESLRQRTVPDWFHDNKLGIFVHWGLYSVPAWAPLTGELDKVIADGGYRKWFAHNPYAEWYMNSMRIPGSTTERYHAETYGQGYSYDSFIPSFRKAVEQWDPGNWADLFHKAGAQYAVLTTKHHDGFLLWPSATPNPFREGYQMQRDLVGELTDAVRTQGLRMGLYYSGGIDWTFNDIVIRDVGDFLAAVPQSAEYVAYADSHWLELTERYHPAVMWNDIGYPVQADLPALFARYYEAVPDGVINDRFIQMRTPRSKLMRGVLNALLPLIMRWMAKRGKGNPSSIHSDFSTPEYTSYDHIVEKKWESTRGIGYSFGYNRNEGPENYLSLQDLVHSFVDIVSKNGNLLLNVGPMADGTIPALQRERLEGLGAWLSTNGEAIYGTRPWTRADGKTADGTEVRYTQKGEALYVIVLGPREDGQVRIEDLPVPDGAKISLLGEDGAASWEREGDGITVTLPGEPCESVAYALKIASLER